MSDSLYNVVSGLGVEGRDKNVSSQYIFVPLARAQIDAAYRADWVARKVVDIPPYDATREWRTWQADKDDVTKIEDEEKRLGLARKVRRAMIRERLYGGGAIIVGTGDGDAKEPLDPEKMGKGGLKYIHVVSRYELAGGEMEWDIASENYGLPKYYTSTAAAVPTQIHPSRVIRFGGMEIPDPAAAPEGWGDSVLQAVDDAVKAVGLVSGGIAALIHEAKLDVISIPGLSENINQPDYEANLIKRFQLMAVAKSLVNVTLLDKAEEWSRKEANFSSLPDVLKTYLLIASGAADIPATRMLSQSPAGLSATGESDIRNHYDRIKSLQTTDVEPTLDPLDRLILTSLFGKVPDGIYYEWRPLWQMTQKERADVALANAQAHKIDVDAALIPADALRAGREAQLIEAGTYPGFEAILEEMPDDAPDETDPEVVMQELEGLVGPPEADPAAALPGRAAGVAGGGGTAGGAPAGDGGPGSGPQGAGGAQHAGTAMMSKSVAELQYIVSRANEVIAKAKPGGATSKKAVALRAAAIAAYKAKGGRDAALDAKPRPLYVRRDLTNVEDVAKWARAQGIKNLVDDMHVTLLYSREPVDFLRMGEPYSDELVVKAGGPRVVEPLGEEGAVVLMFVSSELCWRHESMVNRGASHDYEDYVPHVTLSYNPGAAVLAKLSKIEPYRGELKFGPEIFEPIEPEDKRGEAS